MHFSKYLDQKLKKTYFSNFIPFFCPKRNYHGQDMCFDQIMDFSWHIENLGHFLKSATLANFSIFLGNIFLYDKMDIHTNFHVKILKIDFFIE